MKPEAGIAIAAVVQVQQHKIFAEQKSWVCEKSFWPLKQALEVAAAAHAQDTLVELPRRALNDVRVGSLVSTLRSQPRIPGSAVRESMVRVASRTSFSISACPG